MNNDITNTSFDTAKFGEKLRNHRKLLGYTQEDVAEKIGVSGQAISKWENGECLPDCYNLSSIAKAYDISLDILLDTSLAENKESSINKIKQITYELAWHDVPENLKGSHNDFGEHLWDIWKATFFLEIGNPDTQKMEFERGAYKVGSSTGAKFWDDDGIACYIKSSLNEKIGAISEESAETIRLIMNEKYLNILKLMECSKLITRESLIEKTGLDATEIGNILIDLTEKEIIEFHSEYGVKAKGYKLTVKKGTVVSMILASMYLLSSEKYTTSEFFSQDQ
jgi:Predicted transcriptional regulators